MRDNDAELNRAQRGEERKFFYGGAWSPYQEVQRWRTRFWLAVACILALLAIIARMVR